MENYIAAALSMAHEVIELGLILAATVTITAVIAACIGLIP